MKRVFVSMGGNVGDSIAVFQRALQEICLHDEIDEVTCSSFYQTSPISSLPQRDFLNAVCSFYTALTPKHLLQALQDIERKLGKEPKPKNAPRIIDLDILFYGSELYRDELLEIPHPRWSERKFVLIPLFDLVDELILPDWNGKEGKNHVNIRKMIESMPNAQNQIIHKLEIR